MYHKEYYHRNKKVIQAQHKKWKVKKREEMIEKGLIKVKTHLTEEEKKTNLKANKKRYIQNQKEKYQNNINGCRDLILAKAKIRNTDENVRQYHSMYSKIRYRNKKIDKLKTEVFKRDEIILNHKVSIDIISEELVIAKNRIKVLKEQISYLKGEKQKTVLNVLDDINAPVRLQNILKVNFDKTMDIGFITKEDFLKCRCAGKKSWKDLQYLINSR